MRKSRPQNTRSNPALPPPQAREPVTVTAFQKNLLRPVVENGHTPSILADNAPAKISTACQFSLQRTRLPVSLYTASVADQLCPAAFSSLEAAALCASTVRPISSSPSDRTTGKVQYPISGQLLVSPRLGRGNSQDRRVMSFNALRANSGAEQHRYFVQRLLFTVNLSTRFEFVFGGRALLACVA